ncbi:hypothetical protein Cgig2_013674 [Carnegiea gigantea]|uniref:DUF8040 domain-containing protein n=1 Tax=Carnegiea gigantea TaxID=171969 RepID=A0A9Q1K1Y0_9CARY|nr:hypothetical protein Cgig2_013674 [Carnegiea gigantea]
MTSDLKEHMGDSDEASEDISNEVIHSLVPRKVDLILEVLIPALKSVEVKVQVQNALVVLHVREEARIQPQPSVYQQVLTNLRKHAGVIAKGPVFMFNVMENIRREKDAYYFIIFDNDDVGKYLQVRGMDDNEERAIDTLLMYTLEQISSLNRLDFCWKLLRLEQDAFIYLVKIMIEKELLDEESFLKATKIVAITLYILSRGASYGDIEIRFLHSPSTISLYHNQVLQALVNLSINIIGPYQSQHQVPLEIAAVF